MMMKKLFSLCAALLVSACGLFAQDLLSLDETLKAAGLTPVIDGGTSGYHYYSSTLNPNNAFNGITYSSTQNERWIGSIQRGTYLRYAIPDEYTTSFRVTSYRLHALSCGPSNTARAPRSWALYGHLDATAAADADGWVLIDERSDVQWPFETGDYKESVAGAQYVLEYPVATPGIYRAYKFVPLSSKTTSDTWSTGLMELVFLGEEQAADMIFVTAEPDQLGEVTPGYGVTDLSGGTNVTITASEYGYTDTIRYRCAGYVTASADASGNWVVEGTNLNARSYTCVPNGLARRLTWLWEEDGYKLTAVPEGSGSETIAADPAAEADGYYTAGTQVSLTATGNADPVSTFTGWSGDVPEGAEAAENSIVVTVDAPKTLVANFQRRWKYIAKTSDMPYAVVTDGNWTLYVSTYNSGYRTIRSDGLVATTGSGILDLTTLYEDTAAQGTPISLIYHCKEGFHNNTNLTGIVFGNESISFGDYAFSGCSNLTFIEMPEEAEVNLSALYIFQNCTALKTVKLSNRIPSLGARLFSGCTALETVTPLIPRDTTSLSSSFNGCTSLKGTPDVRNITTITDAGCFTGCPGITGDLDFQNLVTFTHSSGSNAPYGHFQGTGITSVRLPQATTVPYFAFADCPSLTNVVAKALTTVGTRGFSGDSALESVEMPVLREIGSSGFRDCTVFSNFVGGIPSTLESIGDYGFSGCKSLAAMGEIRLPKGLTLLGSLAFYQSAFDVIDLSLTKLTTIPESCFSTATFRGVILPETVTTINWYAFSAPTGFSRVYFCGPPPTTLNSNWFGATAYRLRLYVPIAPTYGWTDVIDTDIASYSSRANYATVVEEPDLIGVWNSEWVFRWTPPNAYTLTTIFLLH